MLGDDMLDGCKEVDEPKPTAGGLSHIKFLIARKRYVLSSKAYTLLAEGCYEFEDLENSICYGTIRKTEKDERKDCVGNKKYVIVGPDTHGYEFYSVGKIKIAADGHTYYVITAHLTKRG
jgi:hypothetical protein